MARKNFTFEVVEDWESERIRGMGAYGDYQPWHQISRSDPSSKGRSHLTFCPRAERMRHQLSDREQTVLSFCLMVPNCVDIREQFKLERYEHQNALSNYTIKKNFFIDKGTVGIAGDLGLKHPIVRGKNQVGMWVMTSDFVLTIKKNDTFKILAIAYKSQSELIKKRTREKLRIEKKYWELEKAEWLLITEQQYSKLVGDTARRVLPWILHPNQVSDEIKQKCALLKNEMDGKKYQQAISIISERLSIQDNISPIVFWQTIWSGLLYLDLKILKYPTETIKFLSENDFWSQNPVVTRRSACL